MLEFIDGRKTYIVGLAAIALGAILVLWIEDQKDRGTELILFGLGLLGLRHGVGKAELASKAATRAATFENGKVAADLRRVIDKIEGEVRDDDEQ